MNDAEFLAFCGLAPKDVYLLTVKAFTEQGRDYEKELTNDGKASADMIEIIQVFDMKTGEDITNTMREQNAST